MKNKSIKVLLFKLIILFFIFISISIVLNLYIDGKYLSPRKSILWDQSINNYSFALMGDSVFCSYYVNSIDNTIWKKIESYSGYKCFPGVLNGARPKDLLGMSYLLANEMPAGSVVFIDLTPVRFLDKRDENIQFYNIELFHLVGFHDLDNNFFQIFWNKSFHKLLSSLIIYRNPNLLEDLKTTYLKRNNYFNIGERYDRDWHGSDYALNRYKKFRDSIYKITGNGSVDYIEKIYNIFHSKGIKPVFVLTPLNKSLIDLYSDENEANFIKITLENNLNRIKNKIKHLNLEYIDLSNLVGDDCFVDLIHLNTCGDDIIARKIAAFIRGKKNH